ncbi:MAG: hypothetical protein U5S82_22465 [Gammaproteobacteria bacterium]|nr:hypothetical protein [Gammaproteobacteria bacterium]
MTIPFARLALSVSASSILLMMAGLGHHEAGGRALAGSPYPAERPAPMPGKALGQGPRATVPAAAVHLYRWRDGRGTIHVSTVAELAPPHARAVPLRLWRGGEQEAEGEGESRQVVALVPLEDRHPLGVYSVGGIEALMADARRVSDALRDRDRLLENLASQL